MNNALDVAEIDTLLGEYFERLSLLTVNAEGRESAHGRGALTWAVPRLPFRVQPTYGYKFHISAIPNDAYALVQVILPVLVEARVDFKCVARIGLLSQLNSGAFGLVQIGKFITIYPPQDPQYLRDLALELCSLTESFTGPDVPTDYRIGTFGTVYYRYGEIAAVSGEPADAHGDERNPVHPVPLTLVPTDPLMELRAPTEAALHLPKRYVIYKALRQRAKGAVLQAIELNHVNGGPPRRVVLKQARFAGEAFDGHTDAQSRLLWQYQCLRMLAAFPMFPAAHELFRVGRDLFLSMEDVGGKSLLELLSNPEWMPTHSQIEDIARQLIETIHVAHSNGIVLADLSLDNVKLLEDGSVRVIDLEDALGAGSPSLGEIGTVGFFPRSNIYVQSPARDYYALGAIVHSLLAPEQFRSISADNPADLAAWNARAPLGPPAPSSLIAIAELCLNEELLSEFTSAEQASLHARLRLSGKSPSTRLYPRE